MSKQDTVHRMTFTESEITGMVSVMLATKCTNGLSVSETTALNKLRKKQFEFSEGIANPAYVVTGVRKEAAVNLSSIGASAEEMWISNLSTDEKFDFDMDRADYNANPSNAVMSEIEFARKQMNLLTGTEVANVMKELNPLSDPDHSYDSELNDLMSKL